MVDYQCLRCCNCQTFQAKQVTKAHKWTCSMCGAKQATQRVYAISHAAKDIRLEVMRLNAARGQLEAAKEAHLDTLPDVDGAWDTDTCSRMEQPQQQAENAGGMQTPMLYGQFTEQSAREEECEAEEPVSEADARFVTSIREQKGRQQSGARRGRGSKAGRAAGSPNGNCQYQAKQVQHASSGSDGTQYSMAQHMAYGSNRMASGKHNQMMQAPWHDTSVGMSAQPYKQRALVSSGSNHQPVKASVMHAQGMAQHQQRQQSVCAPARMGICEAGPFAGAVQREQSQGQQFTAQSGLQRGFEYGRSLQQWPRPAEATARQPSLPELCERRQLQPTAAALQLQASWKQSSGTWCMPQGDSSMLQHRQLLSQQAKAAAVTMCRATSRPAAEAASSQPTQQAGDPGACVQQAGRAQAAGLWAAWSNDAEEEEGLDCCGYDGEDTGFVTAL